MTQLPNWKKLEAEGVGVGYNPLDKTDVVSTVSMITNIASYKLIWLVQCMCYLTITTRCYCCCCCVIVVIVILYGVIMCNFFVGFPWSSWLLLPVWVDGDNLWYLLPALPNPVHSRSHVLHQGTEVLMSEAPVGLTVPWFRVVLLRELDPSMLLALKQFQLPTSTSQPLCLPGLVMALVFTGLVLGNLGIMYVPWVKSQTCGELHIIMCTMYIITLQKLNLHSETSPSTETVSF